MFTPTTSIRMRAVTWLAALLVAVSLVSVHGNAAVQSQPAYSQPELDRMLAPIALYPDPLLSQILMAATYPVEVVEAARWSRVHPALHGDAAVRAVEDEDWDPSVKSLVAFPNVLARMDEDLEWTRQLGDAFLDQETQVMETVQALRRRARAAGSLAGDARIRVIDDGRTLALEPVNPTIIYVPYYDPRVAYGAWWWPAYPPVVWAPWPGYAVRHPHSGFAVGFYWGPAVRISVGFFFGAIDWPHREVRVVSVTNYYYRPTIVRRTLEVHKHVVVATPGPWHHDPHHRRGAGYRTPEVQHPHTSTLPRPARERAPDRAHSAAVPRTAPRSDASAAPKASNTPNAHNARNKENARNARREEARDGGTPQQDRRAGAASPQRNAGDDNARRGQREPRGAPAEQHRRPRRDDLTAPTAPQS